MRERDCLGRAPPFYSAFNNCHEALELAFSMSFDLRVVDTAGRSLLHIASLKGDTRLLLSIFDQLKKMHSLGVKFYDS